MLADTDGQVWNAHLLLAALGIGALRHLPCTPNCIATQEAIDRYIELAHSIDTEGAAMLDRLGAWPVTWSSAGGIAEVRTPYFRYYHPVGAGACRVVANPAPAHATGPRPSRLSAVIERALPTQGQVPLADLGLSQDWYRAGFDSVFSQRARYASMLWQWSAALRGGSGDVLHYPCGDGLLGEMLVEINPRMKLLGIDDDAAVTAAARVRVPGLQHRFACEFPDSETSGRAAILDPELLLSRSSRDALAIRTALTRYALVVIYASDRALRRFGTLSSLACTAGITIDATEPAATSARVTV